MASVVMQPGLGRQNPAQAEPKYVEGPGEGPKRPAYLEQRKGKHHRTLSGGKKWRRRNGTAVERIRRQTSGWEGKGIPEPAEKRERGRSARRQQMARRQWQSQLQAEGSGLDNRAGLVSRESRTQR